MIENEWYIVCFEKELHNKNPLKRKIAGNEIVAFKTVSGKAVVLEDRCCHRNVHLSLGTVCDETIKCGYHGWEFGSTGKCEKIPSLPNDQPIPRAAHIRAYPTVVKHKIVWAYFGDPDQSNNHLIPPFKELNDWPFIFNYHEVKGDIKLIAESLYDPQHINHVHSDSIQTMMGNLSSEQTDFHLETGKREFHGWYHRSNQRNWFEKLYFGFEKKFKTHFSYWFPHSSKLDLIFPSHLHFPERRMIIFEHFYEIDEERCMMIQITTWKNIFRFNPFFAKWFMSRKSNKIVEEDIAFLESNKQWHSKLKLNDMLIKPDDLSIAFMRLWKNNTTNVDKRPDTK